MSYQVLARKWRPRTFEELVGQAHVVKALVNGLDNDRLHHAFLFTGTRGVGKTTIARILAKSLNCEQGVSSKPCGECAACKEVDEGRFVDLIEVDAASRTKVDDTRELLDNVQYAPTRGRYKVYLIDEVHMLSGHSFNALLKTLEEPPPHVKFLLATTDPQKLPVTVLSRCLQFNLKRLDAGQIGDQLEKILQAEGVEYDSPSVCLLARAADGSLRDALSLMDQAIAYGGGRLAEAEVRAMLGTIDRDVLDRLLTALGAQDAAALLQAVADVSDYGGDYGAVLEALALRLYHVALAHVDEKLLGEEEAELILKHKAAIGAEDAQLYYQIALHGRRDLPLAPDPRTGLEMALLRMLAFRPAAAGEAEAAPRAQPTRPAAPSPRKDESVTAAPAAQAPATEAVDWARLVAALELSPLVRELASHAHLESCSGEEWSLTLDESCAQLHNKDRERELKQALEAHLGRAVRLRLQVGTPAGETPARRQARAQDERQQAAEQAIKEDPHVRTLEEQFNARVSPGTVRSRV